MYVPYEQASPKTKKELFQRHCIFITYPVYDDNGKEKKKQINKLEIETKS